MLVGHQGKLGQLHRMVLVQELELAYTQVQEQVRACKLVKAKELGQGPHTEEQPRPQ